MTAPQSSPPISNNTSGKKFSISIKKEYHNLLPLLSEKDFESLKASIKAAGLDVPVIVDKGGVILDGHHRFKACKELGIPLIFTKKSLRISWNRNNS